MQMAEELMERRERVAEINANHFLELSEEERLGNSWEVFDPANPENSRTVYALDPADTRFGHGKCFGYCELCVMQQVSLRTHQYGPLGEDDRLEDRPTTIAPWVNDIAISINDAIPESSHGNYLRKELFLPFIDALSVATVKTPESAVKSAFKAADFASRVLLAELLDHPSIDLPDRAEAHRNLTIIFDRDSALSSAATAETTSDVREATSAYEVILGTKDLSDYSASVDPSNIVNDSFLRATVVMEDTGHVSEMTADVLGWQKVGELIRPTLGEIIAISTPDDPVNQAFARTNPDVAEALDRMAA